MQKPNLFEKNKTKYIGFLTIGIGTLLLLTSSTVAVAKWSEEKIVYEKEKKESVTAMFAKNYMSDVSVQILSSKNTKPISPKHTKIRLLLNKDTYHPQKTI